MDSVTTVTVIVGAYLLGAVPSGLLIARMYGIPDIRAHGSGNIGATNIWRVIGPKAAIWVFLADIGKGAAAVLAARLADPRWINHDLFLVLTAVAVILGNIFPIYLNFRGGKGVNTSLGAFLVLLSWETLICLGVFLVVVAWSRYISLGSMAAACSLLVVLLLEKYVLGRSVATIYLVISALVAVAILVTHRQNIGRLIAGTENKFAFSSGSKGAARHE